MTGFARAFWPLAGFFLWAAQFTVTYAVTAVACARGWWGASLLGVGVVHWAIALATLAALAAAALIFRRAYKAEQRDTQPSDRFLDRLTLWSSALGFLAVAWNALPALILPACS